MPRKFSVGREPAEGLQQHSEQCSSLQRKFENRVSWRMHVGIQVQETSNLAQLQQPLVEVADFEHTTVYKEIDQRSKQLDARVKTKR